MSLCTASIRRYARDLSQDAIAYHIEHCRALWSCIRDDRYDSHYARVIAVYRAELRRRAHASQQETGQ